MLSIARAGAPLAWDANIRGQFITSLCRDITGHLWIGTEDNGIWRYDPSAPIVTQYTHYTTQDGLGDNNAYALVCDKAGRIWAGTLNHGVSVFNGKAWKTYGPVDGPLGSRVFALTVNPTDGGVWGATEAGLFRYQNGRWTYFTRADGLPSDQANALAFAADGTLYVGTQCDGIAFASLTDGYQSCHVIPGPTQMPLSATGYGLPSQLINCLLVTKGGTVYAGTPTGLAESHDAGLTWQYRRGLDWKDKLAGLSPPAKPMEKPIQGDLLAEDYVTSLADDGAGHLLIGHRQQGLEVFNLATEKRTLPIPKSLPQTDYVMSLLTSPDGMVLVGGYGGGLLFMPGVPAKPALLTATASALVAVPAFPVPAKPPTLSELNAMLLRVRSLKGELPVGGAVYLGEDWQTQGDWLGRYGRQYTILCAADAPLDHDIISDPTYTVSLQIGPQHLSDDSIRRYARGNSTDNPRSLYDPIPGCRRQAEADDHGESVPQSSGGPDIWVTVSVPDGVHQLGLYFLNPDGHDTINRLRDYLVEIKPARQTPEEAEADLTLARGRVHNFCGGVYERFAVRGPSKYMVKIGKNNSFNTILSGIFLDHLTDTVGRWDCVAWMGGVHYGPPDPDASLPPDPHLLDKLLASGGKYTPFPADTLAARQNYQLIAAARTLWFAVNSAWIAGDTSIYQHPYRMASYRAAVKERGSEILQSNWRWNLHLWTPSDRQQFNDIMHQAHESLLTLNPDMRNHSY